MDEIVDGGRDIPKHTDYKYDDMIGGGEIKANVDLNYTEIQNQGLNRTPSTIYACSNFALSHCINIGNYIEGSYLITKGEELWKEALNRGAGINSGWTGQEALKMMKDLGYITGYARTGSDLEMKVALTNNQPLFTGTKKCDWKTTKATGVFTPGDSYGHFFMIQGYNEQGWIARNSYSDKRGSKGGLFIIPYDCGRYLFAVYAIIDKSNEDLVLNHKKMIDDKMKLITETIGLMNGKDLDQNMTREQFEIVIGRLVTKLAKKSVEDDVNSIIEAFNS